MEEVAVWALGGAAVVAAGAVAYQYMSPQAVRGPEYPLPAQNAVVLPAERSGETAILRHVRCKDGLIVRYDETVRTTADSFLRSVRRDANAKCLSWRDGESAYRSLSYATVHRRAVAVGNGLAHCLAVQPRERIGIFAPNSVEWSLVDLALQLGSLVSVPLYETLGEESLGHIVTLCELRVLFLHSSLVAHLLDKLAGNAQARALVKNIVYFGGDLSAETLSRPDLQSIRLLSLAELEEQGLSASSQPLLPVPAESDLFTVCFTSGTTGVPKGVMLTHGNMIADVTAAVVAGIFQDYDRHISYLPLPHVFERIAQTTLFGMNGNIGFLRGEARTYLLQDVVEFKPTIFCSVPRLYNRIYNKATAKFAELTGLKRALFERAWAAKLANLRKGIVAHPLWDRLIFGKVAASLGGQVRLMVTGSAPLRSEVADFLRLAFSCSLLEGYGGTETTAVSTAPLLGDTSVGHVGPPVSCCEIKLVDLPEMDYLCTDLPCPRGEVCVRGGNCTQGYYRNPAQTAELIDEHGWIHTGDVGRINPNGTLSIIDRKKNLFKLSQGEYIAPEKLENVYSCSPYVLQVFVDGRPDHDAVVGVVVPDPETLLPWAKAAGPPLASLSLEDLCRAPEVVAFYMNHLRTFGAEQHLNGLERLAAIHLEPALFSVESGLLTPSLKLRREIARKYYSDQISALYDSLKSSESS